MCGITGRVGTEDAIDGVITGLKNLEYRGYDSAGMAIKNGTGLEVIKRQGEISEIENQIRNGVSTADIAIGHTRWSTHGPPTDDNAHPHTDCTDRFAVVHNGIIENHEELRDRLRADGHEFRSDTDTEVFPHLVESYLTDGDIETAFRRALTDLEGSYAVAMIAADSDEIFAARSGSPLVIGLDGDERFLASDVPAFLEYTDDVIVLEDGDVAVLSTGSHRITTLDGTVVDRPIETVDWQAEDAAKGEYDHYMHKEISEQPTALAQTLHGRIDPDQNAVDLEDFPPGTFADVKQIHFVACGTSYHAALYATQWLCRHGVHAYAYRAGEYATSPAPTDEHSTVIGVTQSGETADTLAALRRARDSGAATIAITNVVGSTATRVCDSSLFIRAGPEIGVAATKTFTSQVASLLLLGERIVRDLTGAPSPDSRKLLADLSSLPTMLDRILTESPVEDIATTYRSMDAFFFIGRGIAHPVAMEGALKFKEITYEHAEGFAAGQLKHGPLALVTRNTPVFAVFTGHHDQKTLANVEEIKARGAPVIGIAPEDNEDVRAAVDALLPIPSVHPDVAGILGNVQLQLVAYHMADLLDRAIDKPRNLAKSVTVQ